MPRFRATIVASTIVLTLLLAACRGEEPAAPRRARVQQAIVELHPLEGRTARGIIDLSPIGGGLELAGEMTGLRGRNHAYRVHQLGDCSDPRGRSAGPEYVYSDPTSGRLVDGTLLTTSGDETGEVRIAGTFTGGRLSGPLSLLGRSVIVHRIDRASDGSIVDTRIACGVIGIAEEAPAG